MPSAVRYDTRDKIGLVKTLYSLGLTQHEVAVLTDLSQGTVSNIINNKYEQKE